ncbi:unnamed protein product [Mesocestoides corti]|uniref:EF-hand domain-containing protein n=1 Tax=Mesocestoides corti TaxID=53468 RepID=A0A0R3U3Y9_MESCO|nr:unnamed protein product [Mesocestoides corti]
MEQSDPWAMTSDQRAYYLAQFLRLQPDPSGFLSGQTAKSFFELSKLPVSELSLIWELSDVDSDGQLTLSEFSVAMHLVVLHRNGVMLPSRLPDSLRAVATSSALSAPPPPPPVDPSSAISPPDPPDVAATSAVERRAHLGEHRSLDSACQESVRLAQPPHRRWSASSQSDAVSLAEGMTSFDGRLAPNAQVRHPIAIRANPVPVGGGAQDGAPRPPTPPPRARAKTVTSTSRPSASAVLHQSSPPQTPQFQNSSSKGTSQSQSELQNHRIQQLTAMLLPTQAECERIMRENNELTSELVGLQKRRIALEILLERLTPL